jgi:hypothetical protein
MSQVRLATPFRLVQIAIALVAAIAAMAVMSAPSAQAATPLINVSGNNLNIQAFNIEVEDSANILSANDITAIKNVAIIAANQNTIVCNQVIGVVANDCTKQKVELAVITLVKNILGPNYKWTKFYW